VQAARGCGVLTVRDASAIFGQGHVRAQLVGRRWQCPTPGVLVCHNGPLTGAQRVWVALLAAPAGAVVSGLTAAALDGLQGFTPDRLTLTIPGSSRDPRRRGVVLADQTVVAMHWSTKLGPEDVNDRVAPPRTRVPRSLVDAASERVTERRARAIVLAGVQQGRTRPPALWDALSRRGRCRNRAMIAESIVDAEGGIQSLPEAEFDALVRRCRLPRPTRQVAVQHRFGRYFLDNEWEQFGFRAEVHGLPHIRVARWDEDLLRQNDITIAEGGLLVFSSYAVRHRQETVADQLRRMLTSRGWTGPDDPW